MKSQGYTDLTTEGACEVTEAPWPLSGSTKLRVAGVCQDVCNWCHDGLKDVQSSGLAKGTLGTTITEALEMIMFLRLNSNSNNTYFS